MKTGFFESSPGTKSSIRLQMLLTLLFSFFVIGWQVIHSEVDIVLTVTLLTASFTPKLIQNDSENKATVIENQSKRIDLEENKL
jgi:hypothetical protein